MTAQNSATLPTTIAVKNPVRRGTALALLGVVAFSLTFPATAWGLESFGPWSLVALRSVLAAAIAGAFLLARRVPLPAREHWAGLAVVATGVVVGFPMLTTLALTTSTTSHAAVVVGLLPLTTAALSALRTGARPSRAFWAAALAGAAVVIAFTLAQSGGALSAGDAYLFGALLVCAAGYTEGGRLARLLPGWQVIGWALVLCLPLSLAGSAVGLAHEPVHLGVHGLAGLVWAAMRLHLPRPVRLVPRHGRDRRAAGQPAAARPAAADPRLVGGPAGRAPLPGRTGRRLRGPRLHRGDPTGQIAA